MKHRIIDDIESETTDSVLLTVFRDDEGEDFVRVSAWHSRGEGGDVIDYFQSVEVYFPTMLMCERFITDYSAVSAQDFVDSYRF